MKRLPVFLSFFLSLFIFASKTFAACSPPTDYSSCPQLNPDLNINNRGYALIKGQLQYIPFQHPIDPNAPQLSTLFPGNPTPAITALYQVNDWNWSTNSPDGPIPRPPDLPSQYDWATLVGFLASPGQAVLVPASGYTIGEGNQAIVLYASPNSITIHYGLEDSVASGYTIHLQNIRVDPQLLSLYNQLNQEGREALPALAAGEKIGEAVSNSVLVSIRDSGALMDPRWLYDWFQKLDPAVAKNLVLKWMRLIASQKYGTCQTDRPFLGGPPTKGESFELTVTVPFYSSEETDEKVKTLLKTINLDFPDNQSIAHHLHWDTLPELVPFSYTPKVGMASSLGKITYEVCEKGTTHYFAVEKMVEFETPGWMNELADTGQELAKAFFPLGSVAFSQAQAPYNMFNERVRVLGDKTPSPQGQKHSYSINLYPQIIHVGGNEYSVCWSFMPQAEGCGLYDLSGDFKIFVKGKVVYERFWGPQRFIDSPYFCTYEPFNGPVSITASPGDVVGFEVKVTNLNHDCAEDPRQSGLLEGYVECTIGEGGEIKNCSSASLPMPTPEPRICEDYSPQGQKLIPEAVCVSEFCFFEDTFTNPAQRIINELVGSGVSVELAIQKLLNKFPLYETKTYIITPVIQTPYTAQADYFLRMKFFSLFKTSSLSAKRAFGFKHALQNSTQVASVSLPDFPPQTFPSLLEIYGQAGVKNSYDWVQKALTPSKYNNEPFPYSAEDLTTSLPFREVSTVVLEKIGKNKNWVIEQVRSYWKNSKIGEKWDFVYNQAIAKGWNPAFVIALWIEESGASGVDAYDLGCLGAPANNLEKQLDCLFSLPYADSSFEEFMCNYSEGESAPCVFKLNPNFPKNLEFWYQQLTKP